MCRGQRPSGMRKLMGQWLATAKTHKLLLDIPRMRNQLNTARQALRQVENCWPQLMKIHCALAMPNVNLFEVSLVIRIDGKMMQHSPCDEDSRRNGQNRVESRHSVCKNKSHHPEQSTATEPHAPGRERVVGELVLAFDHRVHGKVVHELDARVSENQARTKHGGDEDAVRHLGRDTGS